MEVGGQNHVRPLYTRSRIPVSIE